MKRKQPQCSEDEEFSEVVCAGCWFWNWRWKLREGNDLDAAVVDCQSGGTPPKKSLRLFFGTKIEQRTVFCPSVWRRKAQ